MFIFELHKHNDNIVFIQPTPQSHAWVPNLLYVFEHFVTYFEWDMHYGAYRIRFWDCFLVKEGLDQLSMSHMIRLGPKLHDKIVRMNSYKAEDVQIDIPLKNFKLRPVQAQSVKFAAERNDCFLGHSRGVGKTGCGFATGVYKLHNKVADHVLMVVPRSVIDKWEKEMKQFLAPPYDEVVKVYVQGAGAAKKRKLLWTKPASFHLVTPETLSRDVDWLVKNFPWQKNYIVTDEHHKFKNKNNRNDSLIKIKAKSTGMLAMSGHDVNRLEQWWHMMRSVDPNIFGEEDEFVHKYVRTNDYGGAVAYKNEDLLAKKLEQVVFRKEKHEVMPELPPKSYEERLVDLTPRERKIYNSIRDCKVELEDEELAESLNNALPIVRYQKMRRFLCMPSLVSPEFNFVSSKMKELKSILEESQKEKIVVFTQWSTTCDAIEEMLGPENCYKITGDVKETASAVADAYVRDSKRRVLIMDTAGALGIEMHGYMEDNVWHPAADTLIFLDECYDHGQNKQIEDRIHRYIDDIEFLKRWHVDIILIRANKTADTKLAKSLAEESDSAKRIFSIISGKITMGSFTQAELEQMT